MRAWLSILLSSFVALAAATSVRADLVELKNGGRLFGDIANASDKSAKNYDIVTDGGGKMSIPRSQVARILSQTPLQDEYHRQARTLANTVEAHWQLALWCKEQKLGGEYRDELNAILKIDPNFEPARLALGHHKLSGGWQSREEVMASRGLVLHEGKYTTSHHLELEKEAQAVKQTDADWNNQLDRWRRWLTGRRKDRSDEALREIRGIKDAAAAPAIVKLLAEEKNPSVKRLMMDVAASLDTPLVLEVLVNISLSDPDEDMRLAALDHLIATGRPGIMRPYVQALRSNDNAIVNRAALALGEIGNRDAIGPLINALVTKHKIQTSNASSDQHAYTFTPNGGTAMNMGGGGPKFETRSIENPAVLAALSKLAGTNFGFNQDTWRGWLTSEAKANPIDVRRDQ
jgi:hypothetical protein